MAVSFLGDPRLAKFIVHPLHSHNQRLNVAGNELGVLVELLATSGKTEIVLRARQDKFTLNEANWVPTDPTRRFEVIFRLYAPTKPLFDKTWVLPDIEKVD